MNQQEPLEKDELLTAQGSPESVEPIEPVELVKPMLYDYSMEHRDGKIVPMMKEYKPLQVSFVIFSIAVLVLVFVGSISNMWGLLN